MWWRIKRFFARLFGKKPAPVVVEEPKPEPPKPDPIPEPPKPEPTPTEPVPHPGFLIENLEEMSEWYRLRLMRGMNILQYILADPRTKERWLTYKLKENQLKTNAEIWDMWVKGDQISGEKDDVYGVTDIKVIMYRSTFSNGVVGYTYLESLFVWVNSRYFSTEKYVASNLGHEALGHQYGFTHTIADYQSTVPWQINKLIEECYDAYNLKAVFPPL